MRSPRMSSCAPTGVAIFFLRAMCPSNASRAMEVTVRATASKLGQAPRPNRLTAANPTTTRSSVTLLGVHSNAMVSAPPRAFADLEGNSDASYASRNPFEIRPLRECCEAALQHHASQTPHLSAIGLRFLLVAFS